MGHPPDEVPTSPSGPDSRHRHPAMALLLALPMTLLMPFIMLEKALRGIWDDRASRDILVTALWLLLAGTILFSIVEGFSLLDSFYFSFITLATIGYGDLAPATDLGKLLTVVYSIAGLGIIAALISTIAAQRAIARRRRRP